MTDIETVAIIDARDPAAGPVARVQMASRVPLDFDVDWFAD